MPHPVASFHDREGADSAFGQGEDPLGKILDPFPGLDFFPEAESLKRIHPLENLADLGLEKNDEKNDQNLPENLEHPGGQKEPPGLSHGEKGPQHQQAHERIEGFGPPEPQEEVVSEDREEKDVQKVLNPEVAEDGVQIHGKLLP